MADVKRLLVLAYKVASLFWSLLKLVWPRKQGYVRNFQFYMCVHYTQGPFLSEFIYIYYSWRKCRVADVKHLPVVDSQGLFPIYFSLCSGKMTTYLLFGFLCVLMTGVLATRGEREPQCHSRFDYEYKVSQMMRKRIVINVFTL